MIYYFINIILFIIIIYLLFDYYMLLEVKLRKSIDTNIRRDILIDLYNIIINVSEISNTKPFLLYGTLLGYIRNNDLICYDYDLDFGIKIDEYELFKYNIKEYLKNNNEIELIIKDVFNYRSIKLIHKNTGISCDLFTYSLINDKYNRDVMKLYSKYYLKENCIDISKNWIDELQQVYFLGRYTYIPNKSKQLLECYYGKDYMTPDHKCNKDCSVCIKN